MLDSGCKGFLGQDSQLQQAHFKSWPHLLLFYVRWSFVFARHISFPFFQSTWDVPAAHTRQLTIAPMSLPSSVSPLIFSLFLPNLSDAGQDTAAHTKTPCAALCTLSFLAAPRTWHSHSQANTKHSAFSNHLLQQLLLPFWTIHHLSQLCLIQTTPKCWCFSTPQHLPFTWKDCSSHLSFLLGAAVPLPHWELFIQYSSSFLHWTSSYRRLWDNRKSDPASSPMRVYPTQVLLQLHGDVCINSAERPAFFRGNSSTSHRECHRAWGPQPPHHHLKDRSI